MQNPSIWSIASCGLVDRRSARYGRCRITQARSRHHSSDRIRKGRRMSSKPREANLEALSQGSKVTALPARVAANAQVPLGHGVARNPGMALDLGFLESMRN